MALLSPYSDVSAVNLDWAGEVAEVVPVPEEPLPEVVPVVPLSEPEGGFVGFEPPWMMMSVSSLSPRGFEV